MSSIIGGVARLPVAKIIDIWGRAEGYMLMVLCLIIGKPIEPLKAPDHETRWGN